MPYVNQLERFAAAIKKFSKSKITPQPKDWYQAFDCLEEYLESLPKTERKVIFIDEMPWIDTHKSDFVTALENFWNSWAALRDDIVFIACGSATSWLSDKLITKKQTVNVNFQTEKKSGGYLQGLDVRGLRGDEAIEQVAKYIDQALATGHREIKILHGTGTGALRSMIRDYLRVQPIVKRCYDEKIDLGGAGITVVELDY
jgi:hypothetical protein